MISTDWNQVLASEFIQHYWHKLQEFVTLERSGNEVFPPTEQVFQAFELTSYAHTRLVILGQDPYHDYGQAHGLAFSVRPDVRIPPSLRNIHTELHTDLGRDIRNNGDLTSWAEQGVLLLNTTLTVRSGAAASHQGRGWETFTDRVIRSLNDKVEPVVFILWGSSSRKKRALITNERHVVIESAHPSPLSAHRGFFGSRPFSRANTALIENDREPIDW